MAYLDFPEDQLEVPKSHISDIPKLIALVDNVEITINMTSEIKAKMNLLRIGTKNRPSNKTDELNPSDIVY